MDHFKQVKKKMFRAQCHIKVINAWISYKKVFQKKKKCNSLEKISTADRSGMTVKYFI